MKLFKRFNLVHILRRKEIFEEISGWEEEKWILTQALNIEEPIHILLVGPPGIGKTILKWA